MSRVHSGSAGCVVGVDGSPASLAALAWAARASGATRVVAVHAVEPWSELVVAAAQADSATLRRQAETYVADWVAATRDCGIEVTTRVAESTAVAALVAAAQDVGAELIAVGVHGQPPHTPRVLGRVAAGLLKHADGPVAFVGADCVWPPPASRSVVVGVGHGPAAQAALEWAAEFARDRALGLSLVRCVPDRPTFGADGLLDVLAYYIDPHVLADWAVEDLSELAAEVEASTPQVVTTISTPRGSPKHRLVEAGHGAALMVVGLHHDGWLAGHAVPGVVHHAVTHAPCPVVVVPATPRPER